MEISPRPVRSVTQSGGGERPPGLALIATPFEAMGLKHTVDSSRPSIEFNRRYDEVALYLTIVESQGG